MAGQTVLFLGFAAAVLGALVMISLGGGKYALATLGLIVSAVIVAAAIWGIVDTPAVGDAFEQGTISARPAIGMFVALAGGLLALAGALMSYRYTPPVADRTVYEREV